MKRFQLLSGVLILALIAVAAGCTKEEESNEPDTFAFIVYPGARYLGKITEVTREAHKLLKPNEAPPPVAVYDTDAPLEEVATFYAKAYGYGNVSPDNLSSKPPAAYYRGGDLSEAKGALPLLQQLHLNTDVSKAQGTYKAAEISRKPNRPQVTVQRPYFDVTTSQVVNRTIILMQQ